jgi:hypothetical protein
VILCWHRLVIRRGRQVCKHCGVEIEACPCAIWRDPDAHCEFCCGSGYLSTVRGKIAKFREYAGIER